MAADSSDQHGAMDISDHVRTWKAFTGLVKWSAAAIAAIMLLLLVFRGG
ncbi:MAG: aa3-type cytochrome c oxidase subunit IV [Alphaproteobacteria bacterium]|nr:aa3-type cytochrome c oxidase subunit IV [Alphaproteobacteria bacterium]